jgi:hypothetical protein
MQLGGLDLSRRTTESASGGECLGSAGPTVRAPPVHEPPEPEMPALHDQPATPSLLPGGHTPTPTEPDDVLPCGDNPRVLRQYATDGSVELFSFDSPVMNHQDFSLPIQDRDGTQRA